MALAEVIVKGLFDILRAGLGFAFLLWTFPILMRYLTKHTGGHWGRPDGHLPAFSLKRIWCKHPVSYYGQGNHGLWAVWCDYCGRRLDRK